MNVTWNDKENVQSEFEHFAIPSSRELNFHCKIAFTINLQALN